MYTPSSFKNRKPFFLLLIPIFILGVGAIVMFLWNAILPEVIGVKSISYWQAMGILILSKILFGGMGFGNKSKHLPPFANNAIKEKWMQMTDEEKAQFKNEWKSRCK
ncbi:MAG: hypothetical protein ACOYKE_05370 [Ferruginibacter sp.]